MLSVLVETKLLLTDDCTGTRGLTVETNCSMWSVQNHICLEMKMGHEYCCYRVQDWGISTVTTEYRIGA